MRGTGPFPVVVVSDPAINFDESDYKSFLASRDPKHLVYHEGEHPTVYTCRPLTLQERRDVRNKATDADRYEAAFVRGLVRADRVYKPDGSRGEWTRSEGKDGKQRLVSDADLETLFAEATVQEVGAVIWHRSSLPFRPGCEVTFPLLGISRDALMEIRPRPAAAPSLPASDSPQPAEQQADESRTTGT